MVLHVTASDGRADTRRSAPGPADPKGRATVVRLCLPASVPRRHSVLVSRNPSRQLA